MDITRQPVQHPPPTTVITETGHHDLVAGISSTSTPIVTVPSVCALSLMKRFFFRENIFSSQENIQIPTDGPMPWVDADKLQRVILNLLSNAFKFTPPGFRRLLLSTVIR
jgi:signal transduction histidine kinase